ncbi:hypothetical protein GGI07_004299 [Coemansia sp. Benny D115]|nr:hypothetical protein GGI07_004299 [Coemansia sp. Benny D115]
MPPLTSRRASAAPKVTTRAATAASRPKARAKRGSPVGSSSRRFATVNGKYTEDDDDDDEFQATTPVKRQPDRKDTDEDELAPPDTIIVARRSAPVFADRGSDYTDEARPEPRNATKQKARVRAEPAKKEAAKKENKPKGRSKAQERPTAQNTKNATKRGAAANKRTSTATRSFVEDYSDDNGAEEQEDGLSGIEEEFRRGLGDLPERSESEDDGNAYPALETPTKKQGSAAPLVPYRRRSLMSPTRSLANGTTELESGNSPVAAARNTRKRVHAVRDDSNESELDVEVVISNSKPAPRKRGRRSVADAANANGDVDSNLSVSGNKPGGTPSRARAGSKDSKYDVFVDIVSPSKFESNRLRLHAQPHGDLSVSGRGRSSRATLQQSSTALAGDAEKWRKKYNDLFELRHTKPEKDYSEFKESAEARFAAADVLIKKLRAETADMRRQIAQLKNDVKSGSKEDEVGESLVAAHSKMEQELKAKVASEKELEKQVALLQQEVDTLTHDVLVKDETIEKLEKHRKLTETSTDYNLRERLKLVQELSGLSIEDVVAEDQGVSYVCRQAGPKVSSTFVLTSFDDLPTEYQYTPCGETSQLSVLPDYFKEPMSFAKTAGAMFFWRMCDHLHQSQNDETATETTQAEVKGNQSDSTKAGPPANTAS